MSAKESTRRNLCRYVMGKAWKYFRRIQYISFRVALKIAWLLLKGKLRTVHSKVRGVTYGDRQAFIRLLSTMPPTAYRLHLKRDYDNSSDDKAVLVVASINNTVQLELGYMAADLSCRIAPLMDVGHEALVLMNEVTGRQYLGGKLGVNYEVILI